MSKKASALFDLFLLCTDSPDVYTKYAGHNIMVIQYQYPKPYTMLAVEMTEQEAQQWLEKGNGGRSVRP